MWDQQTSQVLADLSAPLQGFVKKLIVMPSHSLLCAACEKLVFLWDYRSMEVSAVLKSHKEEVKTVYSPIDTHPNLLFSAGKGTSTTGGLHAWDVRMLSAPL